MYDYRKMTPAQRLEALAYRRLQRNPWHSPPHWNFVGQRQYIISATCYEHKSIIGKNHQRMTDCESELLDECNAVATTIYAFITIP